jgi:hypothetical protein
MDDVQIEGAYRRSVQDRSHSADDDEVDAVAPQHLE